MLSRLLKQLLNVAPLVVLVESTELFLFTEDCSSSPISWQHRQRQNTGKLKPRTISLSRSLGLESFRANEILFLTTQGKETNNSDSYARTEKTVAGSSGGGNHGGKTMEENPVPRPRGSDTHQQRRALE